MERQEADMKKFTGMILILITFLVFTACQNTDGEAVSNWNGNTQGKISSGSEDEIENNKTEEQREAKQVSYTTEVPKEYRREAQQQGEIVRVEYETKDYTSTSDETIIKPAYVYLPYGYGENDRETKYDILYMMHGWTMTAESYFDPSSSDMIDLFDNLIENGDMRPTIIVSATFDTENQPQDFGRSTEEIAEFHQELRNDLMPYIESHFHTYAEGISEADFRNSRAHRAFTGFSLGGVTTWYQFVYNLDYIRNFISMSGDCWILGTYGGRYQPVETTKYLENVVKDGDWEKDDFYIYAAIGTSDPIWDQVNNQLEEMMKSDEFTPDNLHYAIKEGGRHDMVAATEYLYHALPIIFGAKTR